MRQESEIPLPGCPRRKALPRLLRVSPYSPVISDCTWFDSVLPVRLLLGFAALIAFREVLWELVRRGINVSSRATMSAALKGSSR